MNQKAKVGIIGFGNMGSSLAKALLGQPSYRVFIYDKDKKKTKKTKKVRNFNVALSLKELISKTEIILIAIKPQDIEEFLREFKTDLIKTNPLVISIAAGIPLGVLQRHLKGLRIIRAMPNLAAVVGESISFLSKGKYAKDKDLKLAENIFSCIGEVAIIAESYLDKVTSITASGPGYIFYFMDSLYQQALVLGFSKNAARKMVVQTFWGTLKLAKASSKEFKFLIKEVASKKGTTEAALRVFRAKKLDKIIARGVNRAYKRAKSISRLFIKTSNGVR